MRRVEVLRYYGHGKWSDPEYAQVELEKLQKKHPDREYVLLMNMRSGYFRLQVAQVDRTVVDWPSLDDLGLPAEAPRPGDFKDYADYTYESKKRRNIINSAYEPLKARLKKKLNP